MRCLVLSDNVRSHYLRTLHQWAEDCAALHEEKARISLETFFLRRTDLHVRYLALIGNAQPEDLADEQVAKALIGAAVAFFRDSKAAARRLAVEMN